MQKEFTLSVVVKIPDGLQITEADRLWLEQEISRRMASTLDLCKILQGAEHGHQEPSSPQ